MYAATMDAFMTNLGSYYTKNQPGRWTILGMVFGFTVLTTISEYHFQEYKYRNPTYGKQGFWNNMLFLILY
jgi:hypothetical protein